MACRNRWDMFEVLFYCEDLICLNYGHSQQTNITLPNKVVNELTDKDIMFKECLYSCYY